MKNILYIHGLGSDKSSRKFLDLQLFLKNTFQYHCLEWKITDNISELIQIFNQKFINENDLIIIGDSTGANFAYQLREIRKLNRLSSKLIVLSPLLNLEFRIATFDFPDSLKKYLINVLHPENLLIIAGTNDEIIDQSYWFNNKFNNTIVKPVDDTHRLPNFVNYLSIIKYYVDL